VHQGRNNPDLDRGTLERVLSEASKHFLLLLKQKLLLAWVTSAPTFKRIAGRLVFESQGIEVVGERSNGLIHGIEKRMAKLLQDTSSP